MHIELEVNPSFDWETAGNLMVYPQNPDRTVDTALWRANTLPDQIISLEHNQMLGTSAKLPCPKLIRAEDIVRYFLDLQGP